MVLVDTDKNRKIANFLLLLREDEARVLSSLLEDLLLEKDSGRHFHYSSADENDELTICIVDELGTGLSGEVLNHLRSS